MNVILRSIFVGLFVLLSWSAHAQSTFIPAPPQLAAKAWLLMDAASGKVITEYQSTQRIAPASLTKMMTAYIVDHELKAGKISLNDRALISKKAWQMGGSKMFVKVGDTVSVQDLLRGIIIQSGNDASIAMAEHIAGSEEAFADLMNQQAQRLGMNDTHFMNATGWPDPNHYTTAADLAKLARAMIYDYPENYAIYAEKEYTFNGIRQHNRNLMLWRDKRVDGIKTGHTEEAGYCLVSSAKDDSRGGMRLISVVLGTNSTELRASETQKLLTYGFNFFETHKVYSAGDSLADGQVWFGKESSVKIGPANDVYIFIPRGRQKEVGSKVDFTTEIHAPIQKGQELGKLVLTLGDQTISEVPVVAQSDVEEA
ncbi:MAG TPA: D-alanyl-D-alanine carboxypeptidase family protein, partial [Pseudomonadales bacterium]|nr:D-alanyl-D-alanine carboxypeptidase family protein [Pseudomonadales bacterium]